VRIGDLAERTGASRRLLRYYEEQGLIAPDGGENGYRDYDERYVDRVKQIRGLLAVGLPTRIIKQILPCLDKSRSIHFRDATPEMLALLTDERDKLTDRIEVLIRNRDAELVRHATVRSFRRPPGRIVTARSTGTRRIV